MSETTLKPCPFCGSSNISIIRPIPEETFNAWCKDCDCVYYADRNDRDKAIADWNTRADLRPSGKWQRYDDADTNTWKCSLCGEVWQLMEGTPEENHMNYCHNCGAKMSTEDTKSQ